MTRRIVIALATGALLFGATAALAQQEDMDHRSDKDIAKEYQDEAAWLREQAESHRKLAKLYRGRTPPKATVNYNNVAKHCEKLAQYYDESAKEAEGVAAELSK